jgi:hypothetical protein
MFYIQKVESKISISSLQGKEATLALRSKGDFIAEEAIAAVYRPLRLAIALAILPARFSGSATRKW